MGDIEHQMRAWGRMRYVEEVPSADLVILVYQWDERAYSRQFHGVRSAIQIAEGGEAFQREDPALWASGTVSGSAEDLISHLRLDFERFPPAETLQATHVAQPLLRRADRCVARYGMFITGYVVMPEHVHLLVGEPERRTLALAVQMLKQNVARECRVPDGLAHFWQRRYYDFNVWSAAKETEKLKYVHRNPVTRGLVARPEDWPWSSFRHYATGERGVVEIESHWTAHRREAMDIRLTVMPRVETRPPSEGE